MNIPQSSHLMKEAISEICKNSGQSIESETNVKWFYLICTMDDCVKQSGFPFLMKALNGNYLSDIEDALIQIGAAKSQKYYTNAVKCALDDTDGYQDYLSNGPNPGTKFYDGCLNATLQFLTNVKSVHDEVPRKMNELLLSVTRWVDEQSAQQNNSKDGAGQADSVDQ